MRIKAKINDKNEWFIIDTGFSGEVNYEIFDRIPEIDTGEICISEGECYRRFGKFLVMCRQ
jgi:predicted aspartyl protease